MLKISRPRISVVHPVMTMSAQYIRSIIFFLAYENGSQEDYWRKMLHNMPFGYMKGFAFDVIAVLGHSQEYFTYKRRRPAYGFRLFSMYVKSDDKTEKSE